MRILIADDHGVVRQGLRDLLLGRPGWEVCGEAGDGIEASEQLAAEALEAGAHGYLLKSHPASALVSAIESASPQVRSLVSRTSRFGAFATRASAARTTARPLTAREREIVHLIADEKSNKEMAVMLGISVKTVETHRAHLMHKLGFRSVVQVVHYAVRNHMVDP